MSKNCLVKSCTYDLNGYKVEVRFEPKLIRVMSTPELLVFLRNDLNKHTIRLVKLIKADYLILIGTPLKITNASLMVEIWGHLYASKFAKLLERMVRFKIIEKIKERSDTIDCGETGIDSNRKFWDLASKLLLIR
ncbi:MAG: hypothetical protein H7202_10295 [Pedobacter sp.]|nr:hypothetical protein [Pedobacter sp.]